MNILIHTCILDCTTSSPTSGGGSEKQRTLFLILTLLRHLGWMSMMTLWDKRLTVIYSDGV
jgi:hypothetical protein